MGEGLKMQNLTSLYQNGHEEASLWKYLPREVQAGYRMYGCAVTCAPILALARVGISPILPKVGLAVWGAFEKGIVKKENCQVTNWDTLLGEMGCPTTVKSNYVLLTDKINGLYIVKLTSKTDFYANDPKYPKSHFVVMSFLDGEPVTLSDPWFGIHWYTEAFLNDKESVVCRVLLN